MLDYDLKKEETGSSLTFSLVFLRIITTMFLSNYLEVFMSSDLLGPILWLIICLIGGIVYSRKNRPFWKGFVLAFFGPIGWYMIRRASVIIATPATNKPSQIHQQ